MLLSKSQPISKVESLNKATSPYKPMILAQTQETIADQAAAQDVIKSQKGKGRIKKIAREKGQAKNKEKQVYSPSLGSKRQLAQLLSEGEEENLPRKRKCEGFDGGAHGVHAESE